MMEELLHVLWRSAFQAHRPRYVNPSTSCPVIVAALRSAFQALDTSVNAWLQAIVACCDANHVLDISA